MQNEIISSIQSITTFNDLLPYAQQILSIQRFQEILIKEVQTTGKNIQKNLETPLEKSHSEKPKNHNCLSKIRRIYLKCSSLEEILPESVNLTIFSFIQSPKVLQILPTLSTYFHSLACKYHVLYRNYTIGLQDLGVPSFPQGREPSVDISHETKTVIIRSNSEFGLNPFLLKKATFPWHTLRNWVIATRKNDTYSPPKPPDVDDEGTFHLLKKGPPSPNPFEISTSDPWPFEIGADFSNLDISEDFGTQTRDSKPSSPFYESEKEEKKEKFLPISPGEDREDSSSLDLPGFDGDHMFEDFQERKTHENIDDNSSTDTDELHRTEEEEFGVISEERISGEDAFRSIYEKGSLGLQVILQNLKSISKGGNKQEDAKEYEIPSLFDFISDPLPSDDFLKGVEICPKLFKVVDNEVLEDMELKDDDFRDHLDKDLKEWRQQNEESAVSNAFSLFFSWCVACFVFACYISCGECAVRPQVL